MSVQAADVRTIYNSLDSYSISQHLAFYTLYQNTREGPLAMQHLAQLLGVPSMGTLTGIDANTLRQSLDGLVALVNPCGATFDITLPPEKLSLLSALGQGLKNRQLLGYYALSEKEILTLSSDEIDITRGVLLAQLGPEKLVQIKTYEILLDFMALQILARLPKGFATPPKELIRAINDFIFEELRFRFPPHSLYADSIDAYTFLPSVLESRRGVCLGVSILYLSLAQRLGLPLEIVTPPGHIYVRHKNNKGECINIETTARGVHVDSEEYLNVNTCSLQERALKDVIGLAFFNQASLFLSQEKYTDAITAYEKAKNYLPNDPLLNELLAYQYLFVGREAEGRALLLSQPDENLSHCIHGDDVREDFLSNKVTAEGIKVIFQHVDETRESVIRKRDALKKIVETCPEFRSGWFSLAVTWLQLHRQKEALEALQQLETLDKEDPTTEYYLSMLYFERLDYSKAKEHLNRAQSIVQKRNHAPKCLRELSREIANVYP